MPDENDLPEIDQTKCTLCGLCVKNCPLGVLDILDGGLVFVKAPACDYCALCEAACPENAIRCAFSIAWEQ